MAMILRIPGTTRVLGKRQGYLGLPIRDSIIQCSVNGEVPCMETAWELTPPEIEAIIAGQPLILRLLGTQHPPVMIYV